MNKKTNITIIGAGSWGTTLSVLLSGRGYRINRWTSSKNTYNDIKNLRLNSRYTGSLHIPDNVKPFTAKKDVCIDSDIIIFAVPSQFLRDIIVRFYDVLDKNKKKIKCILNVAKGLEEGTKLRLSQVMQKCLPEELKSLTCVLSGPNIASEVAAGLPSVSVVASKNRNLTRYIQELMSGDKFRIYTNDDVIGVEIGGAVKNIIAIASGVSDGLGYKANTKASIITRGLYELTKFGVKLGAKPVTFSGVAGMGDLIATCISKKSRNRFFGEKIAEGEKESKVLKDMYMVAEGVKTTRVVFNMSKGMGIEMPITECVYRIIYKGLSPAESVKELMNRKFKSEVEDIT